MTGKLPSKQRDPIFKAYNRGEIDILFLSNVGGLGLHLMHTVAFHLAEVSENLESQNQATGRVIRYGSHVPLKKTVSSMIQEEKLQRPEVLLFHYISIFPDLEHGVFSLAEIRDAEAAFFDAYSRKPLVKGEEFYLHQSTEGKLTFRNESDSDVWYIADILKKLLITSCTSDHRSVEEQMTENNIIKQKGIDEVLHIIHSHASQLPHP